MGLLYSTTFAAPPFCVKESQSGGMNVEGYAILWNVPDLSGDVFRIGSADESIERRGNRMPFLWSHNQRPDGWGGFDFDPRMLPIGRVTELVPDDKGLFYKASLVNRPFARDIYSLIKAGVVQGSSIGYNEVEDGVEYLENGLRNITKIDLMEISAVIWGMQPRATVETSKSLKLLAKAIAKELRPTINTDSESVADILARESNIFLTNLGLRSW